MTLLLACWLSGSIGAWADGKVFSRLGVARAEIPEQRAMIHWTNGIETLVIETAVTGAGSRFAWVVPLPATPTVVKPVSTGLFPTLQHLFQPRVIMEGGEGWIFGLVVVAFLWSLRCARVAQVRYFDLVVALLLVLILLSMLLPALGSAKGKGGGVGRSVADGIDVVREDRAGVFDVTTVRAKVPEDLQRWLKDQGFEAPDTLVPTLKDLIAEGWVFVAAKAERTLADAGTFTLHPLRFEFPAAEPVYPMRLTGVGSGPVGVDLYVFGPSRAVAPGFRTRYCARPTTDSAPDSRRRRFFPVGLRLRHEELTSLVGGSSVATKLSGRREPSEMKGDVRIGWEDYRAIGQSIRSPRAAAEDAMTYAIWWLAAGTALGYARALLKRPGLKFCCRAHGGWILAGVLLWGGAYLAFPKVDASDTRAQRPGIEAELGFTLRAALMDALGDDLAEVAKRGTLPVELREKARLTVRGAVKESSLRWISTNAFTGRPIREEASPGNYTLFDGEGRLAPQTYDFDGAGNAVR